MRVTVKELVRWLDSFGLPSTPWAAEPADWATALNLLARLLHPTLAQRVEEATKSLEEASEPEESAEEGQKEAREDHQQLLRRQSQQTHPSTQLALQEALEMAERVLGIPQFAVVADLKRGPAENQLALFVTLCALHFAMGPTDTKPFRDFQFTFRIYFDMDADGTRRECTACGQLVHLIERLVLNGHVWHRACLKCALCGRQLYRGAFHWLNLGGDSFRLECVEHRANAVLFGDPKQRLAAIPPLPPPSSMSVSQHSALSQQPPEKRASLVSSVHSPPPRPPPPRMAASAISSTQKQQTEEEKADEDEEESIERKIALAAAARHDAPVPRPRQSLLNKQPKPPEKKTGEKTSWEVLEYPEELNPFGSEEEEEEMEEEGSLQSRRRRPHSKDAAANPFETDSEEEEGIVQVDNPQDRVLASPKPSTTGDSAPGSSGCPSPLGQQQNHPAMVQLVQPVGKQEPGPQPSSAAAIDAKMPEPAAAICYAESEDEQQPNCWQFVPPLGPMPFRLGQEKPGKASPAPQPTAATSTPSEQQHQMHELDTKLRRLHAQLDQWEITGARLEGQMLRELLATQKDSQQQQLHQMHVWRKGNKLANEFAQLVEQRCAALATEAVLVRRYVDHFLALAHAELDRQMREQLQLGGTKDEARKRQFNDLLAQLLHIRNELTELESRERQAKAAKATPPNPTAEKTAKAEAKKEAKKEKEEQQQKAEPLKKKKSAETASEESCGGGAEGVGEEKKKSAAAKAKPKGDKEETTKEKEGKGRLLKNTLKNLKKKL